MEDVKGKRILASAIAGILTLSVTQISTAANNIDIIASPTSTEITDDNTGGFTSNDDSANLGAADISSAFNDGHTVSVTTTESGANSEAGDINIGTVLDYSGSTNTSLTLSAHNDININDSVTGSLGYYGVALSLNADSDVLSGGVVNLNGLMSGNLNTTVSGELNINSAASYNLDHYRASLTAESINVAAGGSFNFTNGSLNLTNSGMDVGVSGLLGNSVSLSGNKDLTLSNDNVLTIESGATLSINGGSLKVGSITNSGNFNYNNGDLTLTDTGLTIGAGGLLGSSHTVNYDELRLLNNNVLTIDTGATLTVEGSSSVLTAGSIDNNGTFTFTSGHLELTDSGLTIGAAGLIGDDVALSGARSLSISGDVDVEDAATLSMTDDSYPYGQNHFKSNLNNAGTVLAGLNGQLTVDGVITNDGAGATLTVEDGATLSAGSINNINGGSFTFTSGQLNLTNTGMTVGTAGLLGDDVNISPSRNLSVSGEISIDNLATLSLYGGALSAGSIDNSSGGVFNYSSGHLMLTNSGLTVGAAGLLGDDVELSGTRYMTVSGDVTVEAGANLLVGNGTAGNETRFQSNLNNTGTVSVNSALASPAGRLTVDGAITNDGATANLNLDGGTLKAGSISNINGGNFNFGSGSLYLTNSGLTVGVNGLLGDNVALASGRYLSVAGDVAVESAASLSVSTSTSFLSNLNNAGSVTVDSGGNALSVAGVVTNDGAGASFNLEGGTLNAGSINNTNGGSFNFNAGTLNLTDSSLTVGNTGLLGNTVALTGRNLYLTGDTVSERTLMIDTGATLTLNGGELRVGDVNNNGTFDFISGELSLSDNNLTVSTTGLLGDTVSLDAGMDVSVHNGNGLIVDTGGIFTLNGGSLSVSSITNNGSFIYNSGDLSSNGDLSIGGSSTYSIDPSSRFYLGNGGVLTVETGAALELNGGSLTAGDINGSITFNSGYLRLSDTDLLVGTGGLLGSNLTLDAGKSLSLSHHDINAADNTLIISSGASVTLDGGGLYVGAISKSNSGSFNFNSGLLRLYNSNLTIGASGFLGGSVNLDSSKDLDIHGTLTVDAGSTLSLNGGSLYARHAVNNGNFNFNSGSLSIGYDMTVGTGGLLGDSVNLNSNKTLRVGALTVDTGSTMSINGGYLSVGSVVNNGSFNFNSGTLSTSSFTVGAGELLGANLGLSSTKRLHVDGTVNVANSSTMTVNSGYMNFGHLNNSGNMRVLGGTVDIDSYYGGTVENNGTLRIASAAEMRVDGPNDNVTSGQASYLQNAGHTKIETGGTLRIYDPDGGIYTQNAGMTTVDGELIASSVVINGGTLKGSGTIDGNLEVWGGALNPGNSPGVLEVTGDFVLTEAGTLHLEVADDGLGGFAWDQLIVGGAFDLQGGLIQISLSEDIDISTFDTDFTMDDFFRSGTSAANTGLDPLQLALFDSLNLYVFDDGASPQWYSLDYSAAGEFTSTMSAAPPSAVPVPAAAWLFGSGLIGLLGMARRKAA